MLLAVLASLAFGGAFLAGLVGVGGAIVMIPLLLYVPPLLGFEALGIKTVAGITMVQVFAAALAALAGHRSGVHRPLFLALAPAMVGASFLGAFGSGFLPPIVLEVVFALMATSAAVILVAFRGRTIPEQGSALRFSRPGAIVAGALVGLSAGLVGAGGAFFLIPVMLYGLHIPVRVTVGTSLAVVAAAASAGVAGKVITDQVEWPLAAALVLGAIPGGRLGAWVSRRSPTGRLVVVLAVAIALVAVRLWIDVLTG